MDRRQFVVLAGAAATLDARIAGATEVSGAVPDLLGRFLSLPGRKGVQIDVDDPRGAWRAAHAADEALFCGSCFKTFVLTTCLQEAEAGRLSLDEAIAIDDAIRSTGGGVFENLSGTVSLRVVLEAMIAHSDNTATDAAMLRVGTDTVRAFIAKAGLSDVRIPRSTRRFFSYLSGYDIGTDMGWVGIKSMMEGKTATAPRAALNDVETMACPASTFVAYYRRALGGAFFRNKATLAQFKHILAMADAIPAVVPPDTPAYLKGGSIDWNGFHCMAAAGQMIVAGTPVTFCLNLNWEDRDAGDAAAVVERYKVAVTDILRRVHAAVIERKA